MSQSPVSRKCLSWVRNSCWREMSVASTIDRTRSVKSPNWLSVIYFTRPDSTKQAMADRQWWFSNTDTLS
jgi:hypothetical protein